MRQSDQADPWTSAVIDRTLRMREVTGPCALDVEFVFPAEADRWVMPWERSLDNLLKWLLDALEGTTLRGAATSGPTIVAIRARQRVARGRERTGARIVFRRVRASARPARPRPPRNKRRNRRSRGSATRRA
jgi:hypothetical protein